MTEVEWLACSETMPLLNFLRGKASERKLRLFGGACCRRIGDRIFDPRCRHAIEIAERFIEGKAELEELEAARNAADEPMRCQASRSLQSGDYAAIAMALVPHWKPDRWPCVYSVANQAVIAAAQRQMVVGKNRKDRKRNSLLGHRQEEVVQTAYLRDIFAELFRPVVPDRAWLFWNDGTVPKMAQVIYDARAFDRLPVLADALEEAGCDNREILDHCRSGGEHVRGCWVVDLLLGKS